MSVHLTAGNDESFQSKNCRYDMGGSAPRRTARYPYVFADLKIQYCGRLIVFRSAKSLRCFTLFLPMLVPLLVLLKFKLHGGINQLVVVRQTNSK